MTRKNKTCCLAIALLLFSTAAFAELKHFAQTVNQPFAGSQSPDDARVAAVTKAKMEALEKAGTYIETVSVVENCKLAKDEITAIASGIVRSEIVSQKNYATDNGFGIILVLQLEVDSSTVEKKMQKLVQDKSLVEKYNEIQQREKELLAIIEKLDRQNRALQQHPEKAGIPLKEALGEQYTSTIRALSAADWNRKAVKLWQNGKYSDPQEAIEYLDKSLQLDRTNPKAYNNRGTVLFDLGRITKAIADYNEAIRLNPEYAAAYNNRGIAYYHLGENGKAIRDFNQAIQFQPENVNTYLFRGAAHKKLYQYEQALSDFSMVLTMAPEKYQTESDGESIFLELNELERICGNARKACNLGLCKAMNFLLKKGFCKQ